MRARAEKVDLPSTVYVMMAVGGLTAANSHYAPPLLPDIAARLHASPASVALLPAATQVGLAIGLFLILPLADMWERRRLLVGVLMFLAVAALGYGAASSLPLLFVAAVLLGLGCAGAQLLTPYAALVAPAAREGEASSLVLSGILCGAFVSKVIAGFVGGWLGWRVPFLLSSSFMLLSAVLMWRSLPVSQPEAGGSYLGLMRSLAALVRREPRLRRHALNGAIGSGCVTAFWATYAVHLSRTFHYGPPTAGLFGLVGIAGTVAASFAGRQVDGGRFGPACLAAAAIMVLGFACLWAGARNLLLFILGVLAIDAAAGLSHAANQSSAFALDPSARGRINSVYMASYFLGGAVCTSLGAGLYAVWGWGALCALGVALGALLLALQLARPLRPRGMVELEPVEAALDAVQSN